MRSVALILGSLTLVAGGAPSTAQPEWLTDFAAAQELARREQRPMLAVLH